MGFCILDLKQNPSEIRLKMLNGLLFESSSPFSFEALAVYKSKSLLEVFSNPIESDLTRCCGAQSNGEVDDCEGGRNDLPGIGR